MTPLQQPLASTEHLRLLGPHLKHVTSLVLHVASPGVQAQAQCQVLPDLDSLVVHALRFFYGLCRCAPMTQT